MGAVPRLIDMKVEPFLLASTLNAVVAQRLVRRICKDCKEKMEVPPDVEVSVRKELALIPKEALPPKITPDGPLTFWHGRGCPRCNGEGYRGRLVIAEILEATPEMQTIIARGFDIEEATKEAKRQGMVNLKQDGILKALEGFTTIEEVMRATQE
jgi:type II secretory ATPase GspE/PulE/Tfp pilus assembly ATPase PilB-like protein